MMERILFSVIAVLFGIISNALNVKTVPGFAVLVTNLIVIMFQILYAIMHLFVN